MCLSCLSTGGKSTLLRQTCVAVVLAQMGCWVPCSAMSLSAVDRIFTRVGANDRLLCGHSTFMVELTETANILRECTRASLVIVDELGRGTSTHDGSAIAYAVAKTLAEDVQCRCLFSTHYHGLTAAFGDDKFRAAVTMYHMAYREVDGDITFLYRFVRGVCDQSHGIHCAKLAGLPPNILQHARTKADELRNWMRVGHSGEVKRLKARFEGLVKGLLGGAI